MEKESNITITNEYITEDNLFDECGIEIRSKVKRQISTTRIDNPRDELLRDVLGLRSDIQIRINKGKK